MLQRQKRTRRRNPLQHLLEDLQELVVAQKRRLQPPKLQLRCHQGQLLAVPVAAAKTAKAPAPAPKTKASTTSAQKPTTAKATKAAKGAAKPAAKPAAKAAGAKKPATKAAGGKAAPGKAKTAQKTVVTKVKRNVPVKQQPKGAGKKVPTTRRCSCCKGKENPKKGNQRT
nr:unnamed protein product [Callosobruchus analis]